MNTAVTQTVRSPDIRLDDLEKELLSSQARIETVMSLLKWTAGFALASLLAVVIQMFSMSAPTDKLYEKLDAQGAAIGKIQAKVDAVGSALQETKTDSRDGKKDAQLVRKELETQAAVLLDLKTELRDVRRDLKAIREELKKPKFGE